MRIINLFFKSTVYTSNVYLVLGTYNTLDDVNTLVDVGNDTNVISRIQKAPTGVGKKRIEKVVLTHSHFDHASMLLPICKEFNPVVYAFSRSIENIDHTLADGEKIRMGDRLFEVLHCPAHSSDSICLFNKEDGLMFSGDIGLNNVCYNDQQDSEMRELLIKLSAIGIHMIYPGHGNPFSLEACYGNCNKEE